jgi:hypothetical protein
MTHITANCPNLTANKPQLSPIVTECAPGTVLIMMSANFDDSLMRHVQHRLRALALGVLALDLAALVVPAVLLTKALTDQFLT